MIRSRFVALVSLLVLGAAGCSVSVDPAPRVIADEALPAELLSPTTAPTPTLPAETETDQAALYLYEERAQRLNPVLVDIPKPVNLDAVVRFLTSYQPTAAQADAGNENYAFNLKVLQVREENNLVVVVMEELPVSDELTFAIAQLVYTITERGIAESDVAFEVDGVLEEINVPDGGVKTQVNRGSFEGYRPADEPSPPTTG